MKGSPILATALACLIMLSMYVGMRLVFSQDNYTTTDSAILTDTSQPVDKETVATYADLYFSAKPKTLTLSHPASNTQLLALTEIDEFEWSGEIQIPRHFSEELEILCEVTWSSAQDGYQFIQLILSPDGHNDQSQTLRAEGNISDIMSFHWKEELK